MARVFLIQPACRNRLGHYYAALCSLADVIDAEPVFVVHSAAEADLEFPDGTILRAFSGRPVAPPDPPDIDPATAMPERSANLFTRELKAFFDREKPGPDDHLVFCSACCATALALRTVVAGLAEQDWPNLHLRFLGDEWSPELEEPAHRWLAATVERTDRVHVYMETPANLEPFAALYPPGALTLAPVPTRWPEAESDATGGDGVFRIGYLGPPRADKGMYRLPAIMRRMVRSRSGRRVRFLRQRSARLDRQVRLWLSCLLALGPAIRAIEWLPASMSNDGFIAQLRRCDAVLLPYLPDTYRHRASGIAVDAAVHGVPIVCREGLAAQQFVSTGNGLAAETDDGLADALAAIAADPELYAANAQKAADAARAWRSSPLIERLSGRHAG